MELFQEAPTSSDVSPGLLGSPPGSLIVLLPVTSSPRAELRQKSELRKLTLALHFLRSERLQFLKPSPHHRDLFWTWSPAEFTGQQAWFCLARPDGLD